MRKINSRPDIIQTFMSFNIFCGLLSAQCHEEKYMLYFVIANAEISQFKKIKINTFPDLARL